MATTSSTTTTTPNQINYNSRDFTQLRQDLINYVQNYQADKFQYFNDASPDMLYLEMLAYIGDTLNYQTDKAFNEAFRESAQNRDSLIKIAQDLGFYNYFPKASSTQAICTINVPAIPNSDGSAMIPDPKYLIGVYSGMQVESNNGTTFECLDEVNFASTDRRTIIPNLDSNNNLVDFTIQKAITLNAGVTKIQRYYVSSTNAQPFLEVYLDDPAVSQVIGVVAVPGNSYDVPDDSAFRDLNNIYVEVEHLAQDSVFIPINPLPSEISTLVNQYTDMTINYGDWVNKPKRFIVRHDNSNRTKLVFGSTLINFDTWEQLIGTTDVSLLTNFSLNQILNNYALGEVPDIDTTLFIQFRSGSGVSTNALSNQITNVINKSYFPVSTAVDFTVLDRVRNSFTIASSLPAVGGTDAMTNEELRNSVGKIFATNDRAVTYQDVQALINQMPPEFGMPFRISYEEIKPKVLNYSQVQNYIATQLANLLTLTTTTDRTNLVFQMNQWLSTLPTQTVQVTQSGQVFDIANTSDQILTNTQTLWVGEKCRLYVLGIDQDTLPTSIYLDPVTNTWQSANAILKQNIKNYLVQKRIIGDWIDIVDATVNNFQIDFTIMADSKNKQKVLIDCLTTLRDYFNIYNWQMNQPIFIANVQTILQQIDGVINVVSLNFWNIFDVDAESGMQYAPAQYGRYFNNTATTYNLQNNKFLMGSVDNVIQSQPSLFLNMKYPETDIKGYVI